ncbi:MAG TPA: hypothetical protein VFG30_15345, partial [Polyangiales bacterium]|nr:hypothetical protein [Polyangiales bacterium]
MPTSARYASAVCRTRVPGSTLGLPLHAAARFLSRGALLAVLTLSAAAANGCGTTSSASLD